MYNLAVNTVNSPQRLFSSNIGGGYYKHTVHKEENYVQMDGSPESGGIS